MKKTRFIPYGYTIREGRTVIEHTEAEIIREIFDEYIKGASLKEIAESLTQRKSPIPRRRIHGIKRELQELSTTQSTSGTMNTTQSSMKIHTRVRYP